MKFSICGHIEQVTDDELYAHKILKEFQNRAMSAKKRFAQKYDNYQGFKSFAAAVTRDGYEIINAEVEYATTLLIKDGKYGISADSLYEAYGEVFLEPWDGFVDELVEILEQSNETIEQATYAREMKKATRGRLVGGGFGLAGAAKGIATAGIFNAATGTAYNISNALGNAVTRNEIAKKENSIYRDSKFREMVCDRIYRAVYTIAGCVIEEYGASMNDAPPRDAEMAKNLMNNYSMIPEKDRIDVLVTALHCNRYEKRVYEHLILEYEGAESAAAIGRLFGMTADIDNLCIITLNRMIPETNILKNRSHDENVALLKKYQQRTESLGFKVGIPAEERISEEVIKSELAEDLNELPIENIAENLDSIQAKKEQYGIHLTLSIEKELTQKLKDAKTVNGIEYSTLNEANVAKETYKLITSLCQGIDGKSYDELININDRIHAESQMQPEKCAGLMMADLQRRIKTADVARRTFRGRIYETVEEAEFAQDIRKEADELLSHCDFDSEHDMVLAKKRLTELNLRKPSNCVSDCLERVNNALNKLRMLEGRTLGSVKEKERVQAELEEAQTKYLQAWNDKMSIQDVCDAMNALRQDSNLHPYTIELFEAWGQRMIAKVQEREEIERRKRIQDSLKEKYSTLNLSDRSRENYKCLTRAIEELSEYEPECTKYILPPIQDAIAASKELYDKEESLKAEIKEASLVANGGASFGQDISYILIAIAAIIFLHGIWTIIVAGGAVYALISGSVEAAKSRAEGKERLKKLQEELDDVQMQIRSE